MSDQGIRNWKSFVDAGRAFFDANRGCPLYQLIELIDEIYTTAYFAGRFPKTGAERDNLLHACFVLCHRALLSAATAIGCGNPEDAPAITRRALEAAKICLVVKADPTNLQEWKSMERRKERWQARLKQEKPKSFAPSFRNISLEPLYEELQSLIAILSDFAVHFTPEHLLSYEWGEGPGPDGSTDRSFGVDGDRVPKEFLMLVGHHRLIHHVFDRCLNGALFQAQEVGSLCHSAIDLYRDLLTREGLTEATATVGERW
jgi:hypothetical protein